jgi:hypothetical protein
MPAVLAWGGPFVWAPCLFRLRAACRPSWRQQLGGRCFSTSTSPALFEASLLPTASGRPLGRNV